MEAAVATEEADFAAAYLIDDGDLLDSSFDESWAREAMSPKSSSNFAAELSYVNNSLHQIGLPFPFVVGREATTDDDMTVLSVVRALLERLVKGNSDKETLKDEKTKLRAEFDRQVARLKRETAATASAEREIDNLKGKLKAAASQLHVQKVKMGNERDDWRKQAQCLMQREVKYKSELLKKDREVSAIKDRLHREMSEENAVGSKDRGRKPSVPRQSVVELSSNMAPSREGGRPIWKKAGTADAEHDLLMKRSYEERFREIVNENETLRTSLRELSHKVNDALLAGSSGGDLTLLEDGVFELPYELCGGAVESDFATKVEALESHSEQVQAAADDGTLNQREELAECHRIIREQQKLLNEATEAAEPVLK